MKRSFLTVLAATCSMILVTGCGSNEGDGPAAPTNDEFVTKADRICASGQIKLQEAVTATFGNQAPTEDEGIDFTTNETIPLLAAQIQRLKSLTPPEGEEDVVSQIWSSMEEGLEDLREDPGSVISGTNPMDEALEPARSYGFRSCGAETVVPDS